MAKYTHKSLAAYADGSTAAEGYGLRSRIALAAMMAVMNGVIFWTYGLTFLARISLPGCWRRGTGGTGHHPPCYLDWSVHIW